MLDTVLEEIVSLTPTEVNIQLATMFLHWQKKEGEKEVKWNFFSVAVTHSKTFYFILSVSEVYSLQSVRTVVFFNP